MRITEFGWFLLILLGFLVISGCAVFDRDNTPLLNAVEKGVVPKDETAQILTLPLTFPLGAVAVTTDAVIVHPASVIDDAGRDTKNLLVWDAEWKGKYASQCAALPFKTALTPVVFLTSFLVRSAFNLPENISYEERKRREKESQEKKDKIRQEREELLKQAIELYSQQDYRAALAITERVVFPKEYYEMSRETREAFGILHLKCLLRLNDLNALYKLTYTHFYPPYAWRLDTEAELLLKEIISTGNLTQKAQAILFLGCLKEGTATELLMLALDDPDQVVRYLAIEVASRKKEYHVPVFEKATQDTHEIIRLKARAILEKPK